MDNVWESQALYNEPTNHLYAYNIFNNFFTFLENQAITVLYLQLAKSCAGGLACCWDAADGDDDVVVVVVVVVVIVVPKGFFIW